MLVLTRKTNERIVIGDNIRITVVGVRGSHVRIGIEAPPEVTILRDELTRIRRTEHAESCPEVEYPLHSLSADCPQSEAIRETSCTGG
jgi:carbon storage regulator